MSTRFIAFYSHKGGVGRSMALANTAFALAAQGQKVLILDMDLEAPGQHMTDLFRPGISHHDDMRGWPGLGVLEMFQEWLNADRDDQGQLVNYELNTSRYLRNCLTTVDEKIKNISTSSSGTLQLMPAGNDSDHTKYEKLINQFNWDHFYQQNGGAFLEWLRHKLRKQGYDYVLIDSRTGISKEFYVTTLALADTVILISGFNWQNMRGTRGALESLQRHASNTINTQKRFILVGSPVPVGLPPVYFTQRLNDIRKSWKDFQDFNVLIPYDGELALVEKIRTLEEAVNGWTSEYTKAIYRLIKQINTEGNPLDQAFNPPQQTRPGNPFSLLRRDYIPIQEVIRYFVDPGDIVLHGMQEFTPLVVTGARGSGKTMLASKFSLDAWLAERENQGLEINPEEIRQIGLYFRIDADFLSSFNHDSEDDLRNKFDGLFSLFFDIVVIRKALEALEKLGGISQWCDDKALFRSLVAQFGDKQSTVQNYETFVDFLEDKLTEIRLYLNNPTRIECPILVPANALLKRLMEFLKRSKRFGDRYFAIQIDEYENYADYQQRIVNTRLKQSRVEDGVTYRLFMRSGGLRTRETLASGQTIEEIHDYRQHSLDEGLDFNTFSKYATTVANRHLSEHRWFAEYGHTNIKDLFKDLSAEDEARLLVQGNRGDVLEKWVVKYHPTAKEIFTPWLAAEENPLRQAVGVVLLNQGKRADQIVGEFKANSSKARDWFSNYSHGALYWLCRLYRQPKRYAGLNQIIGLSGNNIRVFLDFCQNIMAEWLAKESEELPIPYAAQDIAIHNLTKILRQNLYSASRSAHEVNNLLERFGRLCELVHKGPRQSEPEVNHFSIKDSCEDTADRENLNNWLEHSLYEGVLRQLPGNKQKSLQNLRSEDWQLAPWFAPLYGLSTRRKKKLELSAKDVKTLFNGTDNDWNKLFKRFEKKYDAISNDGGQGKLL